MKQGHLSCVYLGNEAATGRDSNTVPLRHWGHSVDFFLQSHVEFSGDYTADRGTVPLLVTKDFALV